MNRVQQTSSSDSEAVGNSKSFLSLDLDDIKLRSFEEKEDLLTGASSEPPNLNLSLNSDFQVEESDVDKKLEGKVLFLLFNKITLSIVTYSLLLFAKRKTKTSMECFRAEKRLRHLA